MTPDAGIRAAGVAATVRQTPLAVAVTLINAGLMTALLHAVAPDPRVFAWFAATLAVAAVRLGVWRAWRRTSPALAGRWGAAVAWTAGAAGLVWGGGAVWLWPGDEAQQLFWVFVIGGMSAGAAALNHAWLPAALGFILPACLPIVARMAMEGHARGLVGAVMILVFLVALGLSARRSSRHFAETVRLRIDLARQTQELAAARTRLAAEIAEHRATEESLRHAQKLEVVGQLAGGIAHDFNNILQAVSSGAALIRRRAGDTQAVTRLAGMVADAARRGESVTRRLLAFAHRGELRAEPLDPGDLLRGLREMLAATLPPTLRIEVVAPPGLPPVLADRGQLETALVNLAVNARDAMPGGGILTLSAAVEEVPPGGGPAGLAPGAYVRLLVADTGTGMDAATLARATEPFFTTKPQGRGTGLGLAMARSLAEGSGGALAIESAPGAGTRVTMRLPVAGDDMASVQRAPTPAAVPDANGSARRAILLLVDDEAAVREVLAQELEEEGYEVAKAADGTAALALLDRGACCEVIVSDLAMPGLDGVAVIREARRRVPGLPAILLTGYAGEAAEQAVASSLAGSGAFVLLRKPVSGSRLAEQAGALLAARQAASDPVSGAPAPPA
ncbi:MAG TPA: response regulator [Falsiroseomonas sp.]|jgi:signal transduction histidine kinase/CheY-like chemotaxis protein|nr:response regulator [Falsiroseomonas sp.]